MDPIILLQSIQDEAVSSPNAVVDDSLVALLVAGVTTVSSPVSDDHAVSGTAPRRSASISFIVASNGGLRLYLHLAIR